MSNAKEIPQILQHLKPHDTVYTNIQHVSKSGMTRDIKVVAVIDGEMVNITWAVAQLTGNRVVNEGVRRGGCGMDMGFDLVYTMGRYLFPDGFGEKCSECGYVKQSQSDTEYRLGMCSRSELNPDGCKFYGRNRDQSGWDNDGGYALNQRWL